MSTYENLDYRRLNPVANEEIQSLLDNDCRRIVAVINEEEVNSVLYTGQNSSQSSSSGRVMCILLITIIKNKKLRILETQTLPID